MLRNVLKCTIAEGHCVSANNWRVKLIELEKFVGLVVARGEVGGRTLLITACHIDLRDVSCSMQLCHVGDSGKLYSS